MAPGFKKVFIIAEAGVNHNGSVETAKKLISAAKEAGADSVKFQTSRADKVISRFAPKAEYQKKTTGEFESQLDMARKLALSKEAHKELIDDCGRKGIMFLSTPFDLEGIDLLNSLGLETLKIPSGEITNLPYLRKIGSLGKKIIISTGMASLEEVRAALEILGSCGTSKEDLIVLHCNTEYPTPVEDVNLTAMLTIRDAFKVKVGYSDHTLGIEVPIAAVALGAVAIEKHLTLDKTLQGPDHKASLEPDEFKKMVESIRNIEKASGDGVKKASPSEIKNKAIARKSIVAKRNIGKGECFTEENITAKRPGTGISPMAWDALIDKRAKRPFAEDELIEL